ncbi:MAG: cytidine/deoxycytidylate deaminase family protein [Deferribacteraceae bacterium]|jgi:dCMP deaminase|nr:cytidine/deoxycytidylate deaminase family protein [Deferribacteraceae bacterium]
MSRPSWDEYFMEMVQVVASRATCVRRKVGAVLVQDNRILATGYNGAPKGVTHCDKAGCMRQAQNIPSGERHEICRGLHAEQNVLIQAAVYGVPVAGATIYCSNKPCSICTKMLINADIHRIVYLEDYPDPLADELLKFADIRSLHYIKGE